MAPPPSTAASCSWSPARTSLQPLRAAYSVSAARWVMEIMEPSSARISEPGGIRPCSRSASSRVVFAATWTPAARSSLVAFWEVAVPKTGPSQARAMAARTRVLPVPAGPGDHLDGAGRGEHVPGGGGLVQPQPARRGVLARVVRAAAQCRA